MIIQRIELAQFINAFESFGRLNDYTGEALEAMFHYEEERSEDCGTPYQLDVVALCCEWAEYKNVDELIEAYGEPIKCLDSSDEQDRIDEIEEDVRNNATLLKLETGGYLVG